MKLQIFLIYKKILGKCIKESLKRLPSMLHKTSNWLETLHSFKQHTVCELLSQGLSIRVTSENP